MALNRDEVDLHRSEILALLIRRKHEVFPLTFESVFVNSIMNHLLKNKHYRREMIEFCTKLDWYAAELLTIIFEHFETYRQDLPADVIERFDMLKGSAKMMNGKAFADFDPVP